MEIEFEQPYSFSTISPFYSIFLVFTVSFESLSSNSFTSYIFTVVNIKVKEHKLGEMLGITWRYWVSYHSHWKKARPGTDSPRHLKAQLWKPLRPQIAPDANADKMTSTNNIVSLFLKLHLQGTSTQVHGLEGFTSISVAPHLETLKVSWINTCRDWGLIKTPLSWTQRINQAPSAASKACQSQPAVSLLEQPQRGSGSWTKGKTVLPSSYSPHQPCS